MVPIRAFALGKARLADDLTPAGRADLARTLAERVVDSADSLPAVVVSGAPEVEAWARARGLDVIGDPGSLDAAADAGRDHFAAKGFGRVIIAHADLPYARSLAAFARDGTRPIVVVAPCHRDDGSNVLSVPIDFPFRFSYGPDSFRRHAAEARRLGLALRVLRDPDLAFDVDVPADLEAFGAAAPA